MLVCGKNVFYSLDPKTINKVYLSRNLKDEKIFEMLKKDKIKYVLSDPKTLDHMLSHNQGIIIDILEYKYKDLDAIGDSKMVLILDHLEDPHNFGAIIRTCEARGITKIIIPKDRSVNVNETVMKTSAGALNYVDIIRVTNLVNAIDYLKERGYFIYSAEASGKDYNSINYADKRALVIGSEGHGVSRLVIKNSDEVIRIPMFGKVNSLNASVAAAILIYGIGDN